MDTLLHRSARLDNSWSSIRKSCVILRLRVEGESSGGSRMVQAQFWVVRTFQKW